MKSFNLLLKEYIDDCIKRNLKLGTYQRYQNMITSFFDHFYRNDFLYYNLSHQKIKNYFKKRIKTKSPYSVNSEIRTLRVFFKWLSSNGYIKKNPIEGISTYPGQRKQEKLLTNKHLQEIINSFSPSSFHGLRNRAITFLFYDCMLKVNEVVSLSPADIDTSRNLIRIIRDNHRLRRIPISNPTLLTLKKYILNYRQYNEDEALFVTIAEDRITGKTITELYKKLSNKIGYKVNADLIRRSGAHTYVESGGDIERLSAILGNKYTYLTESYIEKGVKTIIQDHKKFSPATKIRID